ncbi:MAG TPA: hypothetical protein VIL04_03235 [Solirubrobacterales bacterium]
MQALRPDPDEPSAAEAAPAPARGVSRRGLLAASGASLSALALAACGASQEEEEPSPEEDAARLNELLAAEELLDGIYRNAPRSSGAERRMIDSFAFAAARNVLTLREAVTERGGEPAGPEEGMVGGTGLRPLIIGENRAIAAGISAIGGLTEPEAKRLVQGIVTGHAARVAVLRSIEEGDPAPEAYVMGERP